MLVWASPLLHVTVPNFIAPLSSPVSPPGSVLVVWFVIVHVPLFPALSPCTSTFMS